MLAIDITRLTRLNNIVIPAKAGFYFRSVIPAEAGIHYSIVIPAKAGIHYSIVIPAKAGIHYLATGFPPPREWRHIGKRV